MRKHIKTASVLGITTIALGAVLGAIFGVASAKNYNNLVFANFGQYESLVLQNRMTSNFKKNFGINLNYSYYNYNNQLPAMYANNQLDIGVPTDYEAADLASQGLIRPFSYVTLQKYLTKWNKTHPNQTPYTLGYYLNGQFTPIYNAILPIQVNLKAGQYITGTNKWVQYTFNSQGNTATTLLGQEETEYKYSICNLMAPNVICDITQLYLHWETPNGHTHINVFQYDLPYFFQNYTFDFTTYGASAAIKKQLAPLEQNNIPWAKALNIIQNCSWFHSKNNHPEVAMVTSPQSVYSVAAAVQFQNGNNVPITNPTAQISSIQDMRNTLSYFTKPLSAKYLGNNSVYESASSEGVINQMDWGTAHGGFCYNGDALSTSMGGYLGKSANWNNINPSDFYVIRPQYTMIALDTVGMNNSIPSQLLYPAYIFMYKLCLQGADASPYNQQYYPWESSFTGPQGNTIFFNSTPSQLNLNKANKANIVGNSYNYITSKYSYSKQLTALIQGNENNEEVACPYYSWSQAAQKYQNFQNVTVDQPWKTDVYTQKNETAPLQDFIGANYTLNPNNFGPNIAAGLNAFGQTNVSDYYYGIMQNFWYNLYMSPWLNITNWINENYTGSNSSLNQYGNWFTDYTSDPNLNAPSTTKAAINYWNKFNNWFENIYTINPSNYSYQIPQGTYNTFKTTPYTCVEIPLTNEQMSNQEIAFNDAMYQDFSVR